MGSEVVTLNKGANTMKQRWTGEEWEEVPEMEEVLVKPVDQRKPRGVWKIISTGGCEGYPSPHDRINILPGSATEPGHNTPNSESMFVNVRETKHR